MAARAEHHVGAPRAPARGMSREIMRAKICLGLDDASGAQRATVIVHEMHADQCARDGERAAFEKAARGFLAAIHRARW